MGTIGVAGWPGLRAIRELGGLVRFSHTLFALPFALLGAAMAAKTPDGWTGRWRDWLGILLCMVTARSAAMAFNRLVDRRIDGLNPRTSMRHLPSGRLSTGLVVGFTLANAAGFVASTLLFLPNVWPIALSGAGAGVVAGLLVCEEVHESRPLLARPGAGDGADGRLDRAPRFDRLATGDPRAGGPALGVGLRHHLRMPGRGFRRRQGCDRSPLAWVSGGP